MIAQHFFDSETSTLTYVLHDDISKDAVVIDPVLDFDPPSGKIEDRSLQPVLSYLKEHHLSVRGILETHAHADHLSAAQLLKQKYPQALVCIGEKITVVQTTFKDIFQLTHLSTKGDQFDLLFKDFQNVQFGSLSMTAIPTPGHTPACMSYLFGDFLFTGDALFMPDYGTGRCDFPGGSAHQLYRSITQHLYSLKETTRVFVGHDYSPNGRSMMWETTIKESKEKNIHIHQKTSVEDFVHFREGRDKTLKAPRLLYPSLQVNINGGILPEKDHHQRSYLKIPLKIHLTSGSL